MNNNLSLIFLLKGFLKRIPFPFIQIILDYSLKRMQLKYPRIFSKVAEREDYSYLIIPIDLPFNFLLIITKDFTSLTVEQKNCNPQVNSTIKASLFNLLKMFEGKLDGDAAFFSKSLIIEGSTAAIVTLRNAIESENINIVKDLTEDLGIFKKVIRKVIYLGVNNFNNINVALKEFQEELLQDCNKSINYNNQEINTLKEELNKIKTELFK